MKFAAGFSYTFFQQYVHSKGMHIMLVESEHLFVTTAHKNICIANIHVYSTVMNCTSNVPAFICV